jgi:probable blue pigment (indigoidine) exporter
MLGMMSPVTAVALGWLWLGQSLSMVQALGAVIVLASVWVGQRANRPAPPAPLSPAPLAMTRHST